MLVTDSNEGTQGAGKLLIDLGGEWVQLNTLIGPIVLASWNGDTGEEGNPLTITLRANGKITHEFHPSFDRIFRIDRIFIVLLVLAVKRLRINRS